MNQRGREALLTPKSMAAIAASARAARAGHLMMCNFLAGDFSGPIPPVTQK